MPTYTRNYLTQVVFQLSFKQIENIQAGLLPEFSKFIQEEIPRSSIITKQAFVLSFASNTSPSQKVINQWAFQGEKLSVIVSQDSIQIQNKSYTNYNDYHPKIVSIVNKFIELYEPITSNVSIRYVNNISFSEGSTYDFGNLISADLLAPTNKLRGSNNLSRSLGTATMQDGDLTTRYSYGFSNSSYPNLISKREFLIDIDSSKPFNSSDSISNAISNIRTKVNALFELSIEDGLRGKMNAPNS